MTRSTTGRRRRPRPDSRGSRTRADVRRASGEGSTRYFDEWPQVAAWIASPAFITSAPGITSVRLLHRDPGRTDGSE